jgi:hypothetical protein
MKRLLQTLYIGVLLLLWGCSDLDVSPASSIDKDEFYETEDDIESAVNGIYAIFTNWPSGFHGMYNNLTIYLGDLTTEYVKAGANTNSAHIRELSNNAVQPANQFIENAWEESYIGINRANIVIDKVQENTSISEESRDRYVNEAKYLRALFYFNIVRWWGDVPLVLHDGDGEGEPRTDRDEVYAQIVSDLEDAANLPETFSGSTEGRATRGAALATLSKVYLTWAQTDSNEGNSRQAEFYKKAVEYADKVTALNQYQLVENTFDLFAVDKKNGPEHIFSIQHNNMNNITGHCTFAMGWSDSEPVLITTDTKFYEEMDSRDQRKESSWAKHLYNPNKDEWFTFKVPLFRKYIDTINYAKNQYAGENTNTVYIRYAEVLLIKAEAENELNGPTSIAYEAINEVRRRAYRHFPVTTPSEDDLPAGLTKVQFREALREERFSEFILEGQRWFDLVRWRILVKTVSTEKTGVTERNYLFPVPSSQITLNPNLTQNWGYSGETTGSPYAGYE